MVSLSWMPTMSAATNSRRPRPTIRFLSESKFGLIDSIIGLGPTRRKPTGKMWPVYNGLTMNWLMCDSRSMCTVSSLFPTDSSTGTDKSPGFSCSKFILGEEDVDSELIGLMDRVVSSSDFMGWGGDMWFMVRFWTGPWNPDDVQCSFRISSSTYVLILIKSLSYAESCSG